MSRRALVVAASAFVLLAAGVLAGQSPSPDVTVPDDIVVYVPMKPVTNPDGPTVYQDRCAVCHGPSGRGDGRAARAFVQPVPDLTLIVVRDGRFDAAHVLAHVRNAGAQPTPMPRWGHLRLGNADAANNVLVLANLTDYLETLQASGVTNRTAQPNTTAAPDIVYVTGKAVSNPDGATVYQDYCSACHGVTAKGNGPAARLLQRPAPDLTRITARDGGFHSAHVIGHIQNVGPRSATPMPCWGQELKSASHDPTMNWLIVTNLAGYLATLQTEP